MFCVQSFNKYPVQLQKLSHHIGLDGFLVVRIYVALQKHQREEATK